jgi:hypothetical protein
VHPADALIVPGDPDKAGPSLFPDLDGSLERATWTRDGFPFSRIDEVIQLEEIHIVSLQPVEGELNLFPGLLVVSLVGLGGEEELVPVVFHPQAEVDFRFPTAGGRIDMVDTVFKKRIQDTVDLLLGGAQKAPAPNMVTVLSWPVFSNGCLLITLHCPLVDRFIDDHGFRESGRIIAPA